MRYDLLPVEGMLLVAKDEDADDKQHTQLCQVQDL